MDTDSMSDNEYLPTFCFHIEFSSSNYYMNAVLVIRTNQIDYKLRLFIQYSKIIKDGAIIFRRFL